MWRQSLRATARMLCTKGTAASSAAPAGTGTVASETLAKSARANAGIRGFIDAGEGAGVSQTGRAWRTHELRLKSYDDLHRLWFVLLRERNVLLTEKEWCRSNGRHWLRGESNLYKVKRSMARLKGVVGERTRVYKARQALKAAAEEKAEVGLADVASDLSSANGIKTRL
jgi:large subunit ribosomal protein L47